MDEYYYYAVAIFLMSFGSIATTLVETRSVSLQKPGVYRMGQANVPRR
jgi:hypothetical protein